MAKFLALLRKNQRNLHVNTFEAIVAFLTRYSDQFAAQAGSILEEVYPFLKEHDLELLAYALKTGSLCVGFGQSPQLGKTVDLATELAHSVLVQGKALQELHNLFGMTAPSIRDEVLERMIGRTSKKHAINASCAANVIVKLSSVKQTQRVKQFIQMLRSQEAAKQISGAYCLGETGRISDLSTVPGILDEVSALFRSGDEEVRTVGSICLGLLTVGNPDFFLQKVFDLLDKANKGSKYLFLYTIRDIIVHSPHCLKNYLPRLLPLLMNHSAHEDIVVRSLVTENIGRLFVVYSHDMMNAIESGLKDRNALTRQTVVGSFKYGGAKSTEAMSLEMVIGDLRKLVMDKDVTVQKGALEALMTIVHNQPKTVAADLEPVLQAALSQTAVRPELISEVDLGPFKHKVDNGVPLRIASFNLIEHVIEKYPHTTQHTGLVDAVIRGLDDPQEEVMVNCMHVVTRLHVLAQSAVLANLDHILDSFEKQLQKHLKNVLDKGKSNEKSQNIVRAVMRVIAVLQRNADIESNTRFTDLLKAQILDNPVSKDIYEKIVKTISAAN